MARSSLIRLREKSPLRNQVGFALTEILVATTIVAGVIAAIATGISGALKLSRASENHQVVLLEAQNIAGRLHTGLPERDVLAGYDTWELAYQPVVSEDRLQRAAAIPVEVTAQTISPVPFSFTTIVLRTPEQLEARQ